MSREYAVVVGDNRLFQSDAVEGTSGSAETSMTCRARTKRYIPYGPAGDAVLKRVHIEVTHRNGCSFDAIPYYNGLPIPAMRDHFSALPSPTGVPVRQHFILPVSVSQAGGAYTTGRRGTSFGLAIVAENPRARFEVEIVALELIPLNLAKATEA